jgi:hypothetical protein
MTRPLLLALLFALVPRVALACPVCFQNVDSPLLDAARLGVIAMVGITLCVLGAFGAWFLRLRRLAAEAEQAETRP